MWGAEIGLNEHGVAIGNESLFSKVPANKKPALLGMDLLRLGLERGKSSREALEIITDLLEEFGQGGNCIQPGSLYYHNSFLISDPQESWVLETIDRHWAARIVSPSYSISNLISLDVDWDRSSAGFRTFLIEQGFAKTSSEINLREDLSDFIYTTFSDASRRCQRTRELLSPEQNGNSIQSMAAILRDHATHPDPAAGIAGADICMHASFGPIRVSQTTGSIIAYLDEENSLIFATGTSAPCTGIFKPVWLDCPLVDLGQEPDSKYDPTTLFWSHERLHRSVIWNYQERLAAYQADRDALEAEFIEGAFAIRYDSREKRQAYSAECFQRAADASEVWLDMVQSVPPKPAFIHAAAWNAFNKAADFFE